MSGEYITGVLSGTRNGKPLVVTTPKRCTDVATGEVYQGMLSGTRNGKPLVVISQQRCDGATSNLANGRGYLGLLSGTRNGKPLLVVPCGPCTTGETFHTFCECDICCTLDATLEVRSEADSNDLAAPVDATLTCEQSFTITNYYYCYFEETPEELVTQSYEQAWQGGTGTGTWVSGDYTWRTVVWVSDTLASEVGTFEYGLSTFDRNGNYKIYFAATEYRYYNASDELVSTCCAYEWGVLVEYTQATYFPSSSWGFWATWSNSPGGCSVRWDNSGGDPGCPEGMIRNEGDAFADGQYLTGVCPRNAQDGVGSPYAEGSSTLEGCVNGDVGPIAIVAESWGCAVALCAEPDYIRCARITIADNCEPA